MISSDEKTSIQARCRCHPTLAPGRARAMRVNHEYGRGGAAGLPGRLRRPPGEVFGRCEAEDRHRAVHGPGRAGHDHRALRQRQTRVLDRRQRLLPPRQEGHRPSDARRSRTRSWSTPPSTPPGLNQIEIFFSIVQRKVVSPNDFTDLTRSGTGSEHSKTATTPRHSRSSGSSPPPTWTICWPDSTDTHPPTDTKNPLSPWQPDQPPKDFRSRPLSVLTHGRLFTPAPLPEATPPGEPGVCTHFFGPHRTTE